jgi:hypothetical protein
MTDFDAALAGFATLDEVALARPWSFRDLRGLLPLRALPGLEAQARSVALVAADVSSAHHMHRAGAGEQS